MIELNYIASVIIFDHDLDLENEGQGQLKLY